MKVENGKKVSVDYTLTVDGQIADQSMPGQPLEFICGLGMLLPKFEAIVELPKSVFMMDGKVAEDILFVGSQIPMATADGQHMMGVVKEVKDEAVVMDFNSPMAGKTLNFDVTVVDVVETTPEDLAKVMGGGCGCGECGGGCGDHECGEGCDCGGCN